MSLIPRSRLSNDSARSPRTDAAPTPVATSEPASPSQDFFGLTLGAIGCLPNRAPKKYPPVSESTTPARVHNTRRSPSAGRASSTANPARNGTYTAIRTAAAVSRWYPAGPSPMRQTRIASTVASSPSVSASAPPNQAIPAMTGTPASTGAIGGRAPGARTARTISQVPRATAATTTARKAGRQTNSDATTTAPSVRPTAIAAGRFRPARPAAGFAGTAEVGAAGTGAAEVDGGAVEAATVDAAGPAGDPVARSVAAEPSGTAAIRRARSSSRGNIRPRAARLPCA